jgi:hypothetical protein
MFFSFKKIESFADKKHFPPSLKPILFEAAKLAMEATCLNDNFFAHITAILPYNTFTMKVFLKINEVEIHWKNDCS